MAEKNKRSSKNTERVLPSKDKRAERKVQDFLRRPHDIDEDWDDYDLVPMKIKFKKSQKLD